MTDRIRSGWLVRVSRVENISRFLAASYITRSVMATIPKLREAIWIACLNYLIVTDEPGARACSGSGIASSNTRIVSGDSRTVLLSSNWPVVGSSRP